MRLEDCSFDRHKPQPRFTVERVRSASNPKAPSRALGCVFVPFFALGLFFVVMVAREAIASAATYTWQSVPCRIMESEVRESSYPSPWFGYLRYTWSEGESVRSSRPFRTYREAVLFTRRWPAGSRTTCYLDPRDPAGALLERKGIGLVASAVPPDPPALRIHRGRWILQRRISCAAATPRLAWACPQPQRRPPIRGRIADGSRPGSVPGVSTGSRAPRHRRPLVARPGMQNPSQ